MNGLSTDKIDLGWYQPPFTAEYAESAEFMMFSASSAIFAVNHFILRLYFT